MRQNEPLRCGARRRIRPNTNIIPLIFFSDRGSTKSSKRKSDDDDEILINDQYGHSVRVRKTGMNTYTGNDGHEYEKSATGGFQRKMYD